jgi:hypothetical protein
LRRVLLNGEIVFWFQCSLFFFFSCFHLLSIESECFESLQFGISGRLFELESL